MCACSCLHSKPGAGAQGLRLVIAGLATAAASEMCWRGFLNINHEIPASFGQNTAYFTLLGRQSCFAHLKACQVVVAAVFKAHPQFSLWC